MLMPDAKPVLQVHNLWLTYPNADGGLRTLQGLNFSVARQEFLCVLGPSGSGKTSLLRILAGLLKPTRGEVLFCQEETHTRPRIGFVFQAANLMPWRTVLGNITLPLELQGVKPEQARPKAEELITLVGLQGFEDSWPRDLSGGMAQRVALARALIQDPDLLLLDEPFGSLDALTRERMGEELLNLWQARRTTVLMVTHSISEALILSDRVLVLTPRPGQICLDMIVDLPRPRQADLRYTAHFGELSQRLRHAIS
jgi:NitT/TauT family transport system ATP-binding protein